MGFDFSVTGFALINNILRAEQCETNNAQSQTAALKEKTEYLRPAYEVSSIHHMAQKKSITNFMIK